MNAASMKVTPRNNQSPQKEVVPQSPSQYRIGAQSMNGSFYNERLRADPPYLMNRTNGSFTQDLQGGTPQNKQGGPNYTVTVDDLVKSNLKKSPFGIDLYHVPKVERAYLLKPHQGKIDKEKRINFAENEAKRKQYVPAPSQYNTVSEWNQLIPKQTGKFLKGDRTTIAGEIMKNSKKLEKTTPSPNLYNTSVWKKIDDQVVGNYKQ